MRPPVADRDVLSLSAEAGRSEAEIVPQCVDVPQGIQRGPREGDVPYGFRYLTPLDEISLLRVELEHALGGIDLSPPGPLQIDAVPDVLKQLLEGSVSVGDHGVAHPDQGGRSRRLGPCRAIWLHSQGGGRFPAREEFPKNSPFDYDLSPGPYALGVVGKAAETLLHGRVVEYCNPGRGQFLSYPAPEYRIAREHQVRLRGVSHSLVGEHAGKVRVRDNREPAGGRRARREQPYGAAGGLRGTLRYVLVVHELVTAGTSVTHPVGHHSLLVPGRELRANEGTGLIEGYIRSLAGQIKILGHSVAQAELH